MEKSGDFFALYFPKQENGKEQKREKFVIFLWMCEKIKSVISFFLPSYP